jgi:hypothetical protein
MTNPARDRETVRRALRAGAVVWLVAALGLGVASIVTRGTMAGETAALIVAVGLVIGGLAATLWLMLANVLDLFAGAPPGLRRWLWTAGILLFTAMVVPTVGTVVAG